MNQNFYASCVGHCDLHFMVPLNASLLCNHERLAARRRAPLSSDNFCTE